MKTKFKLPTRQAEQPTNPALPAREMAALPIRKKPSIHPQTKGNGQGEDKSIVENNDVSPRKPARRRIDARLIDAVAALVSRGLTESESCRQMHIDPKTFFNFKLKRKNDERFKETLEKFRSARIEDLIAKIEASAEGKDMKQRDWRAAKFLLEVLDRQRFNTDRPAVEIRTGPTLDRTMIESALRRVYDAPAEPKTIDLPATKALPAPTPQTQESDEN